MTTAVPQQMDRTEMQSRQARGLILANPKAGGLLALAPDPWKVIDPANTASFGLIALEAAIERLGLNARVQAVESPAELPELLRKAQAEGYDTIFAAGGDGTVRTVAQHLVGSTLRLGILPMGTDNNFARALGIPFDLDDALQVLATGHEQQVDVGRIGPEYFLESAGVGLFADAIYAFGEEEPRKHQVMRLLNVLGPLYWNLRARRLTLTLDGEEQEEQVVMVTVANAAYMGPSVALAPNAGLSDGLFDVVILGALTRWELIRFAIAALRGNHLELPKVRHARAQTVEIRRSRPNRRALPVHADDHIAAQTPVRLEVMPAALRVLVPTI